MVHMNLETSVKTITFVWFGCCIVTRRMDIVSDRILSISIGEGSSVRSLQIDFGFTASMLTQFYTAQASLWGKYF